MRLVAVISNAIFFWILLDAISIHLSIYLHFFSVLDITSTRQLVVNYGDQACE